MIVYSVYLLIHAILESLKIGLSVGLVFCGCLHLNLKLSYLTVE